MCCSAAFQEIGFDNLDEFLGGWVPNGVLEIPCSLRSTAVQSRVFHLFVGDGHDGEQCARLIVDVRCAQSCFGLSKSLRAAITLVHVDGIVSGCVHRHSHGAAHEAH